MDMNNRELEALEEKISDPSKKVVCPRCGNIINYEKRGNSIAVECSTPNCISDSIRGL